METHSSILPGESHGQRSLVGCSPWGCKESDTTEWLTATNPNLKKHKVRQGKELMIFCWWAGLVKFLMYPGVKGCPQLSWQPNRYEKEQSESGGSGLTSRRLETGQRCSSFPAPCSIPCQTCWSLLIFQTLSAKWAGPLVSIMRKQTERRRADTGSPHSLPKLFTASPKVLLGAEGCELQKLRHPLRDALESRLVLGFDVWFRCWREENCFLSWCPWDADPFLFPGTWTSWTSGVWRWAGGRCSLLLGVAGESKGLTWMLCVLFHQCGAPVSAGTAHGLKVCVSLELNQEWTQIRRGSTLVKLLRSILQSWTVALS